MSKIQGAVIGCGTIGLRTIRLLQNDPRVVNGFLDTHLIGYTKETPTQPLPAPFYVPNGGDRVTFEEAGFFVQGTFQQLLAKTAAVQGIVIDCTPAGKGMDNKPFYETFGIKAIFNGGEPPTIGFNFFAPVNLGEANNHQFLRISSCNETGLLTLIATLQNLGLISITAALARRDNDLGGKSKRPLNALTPKLGKTHYGAGIQAVLGNTIKVNSQAVIAPTTLMHLHMLWLTFNCKVDHNEIIQHLRQNPRILVVSQAKGFTNTADIIEWARRNRMHADVYEVCIWEDSVEVLGDIEVQMITTIHQEAVVIPTILDALLAQSGYCKDAPTAMRVTNQALGIGSLRV